MRVTNKLLRHVTAGASWTDKTPRYNIRCRIKNVFIDLHFADISPFTYEGYEFAISAWEATRDLAWAMAVARIINQSPAIAVKRREDMSRVFKSLISENHALVTLPDELLAILLLEGFIE